LVLPTYASKGCPYNGNCAKESKYLGYQEGLAEAESRVKAREREIVEFYQSWQDTWIHTRDETKAEFLEKWGIPWQISFRRCLEAWLQGKE
jgi:hypothetical protein